MIALSNRTPWTVAAGPLPLDTSGAPVMWREAYRFELAKGNKRREVIVRMTQDVHLTGRLQPSDVVAALQTKGLSVVEGLIELKKPPPLVTVDVGRIAYEGHDPKWLAEDGGAESSHEPSVLEVVAILISSAAGAALGVAVGWTIPEPYIHPVVDPVLYGAVGAVGGAFVGGMATMAHGGRRWLPPVGGLAFATAVGGAGVAFNWSSWDRASTTALGFVLGVALCALPGEAISLLAIGGVFGTVDLVIEAAQGDLGSLGEAVGLFLRDLAAVGLVTIALVASFAAALSR